MNRNTYGQTCSQCMKWVPAGAGQLYWQHRGHCKPSVYHDDCADLAAEQRRAENLVFAEQLRRQHKPQGA